MSREDDWKIHELMGNDLTGWEWYEYHEDDNEICKREANGWIEHFDCIPHYSTTWEGAGLVMEGLEKESIPHMLRFYNSSKLYWATVDDYGVYDPSAPLALAKAYISAMEERDNG
jgi:hypothetical protein